mgnify:CR=1 FL=1
MVLSADTDTERVSKCIEIGADDYLPKPFNPTILRARISSELRKRSLRSMENEYVEKIEQEKKHSEALLRNILPPEIAVRLRKGETNIADHFEDASIIFTDVVGFTKITARMRAFEIVACLNRLFSDFDRLADDVGAEKIKTIGDSYMAALGLPVPRPNHARIAAKLALDFVSAAQRLQSSLPVPFLIRVGVHSGPVMAGVIAPENSRMTYGETPSTLPPASRPRASRTGSSYPRRRQSISREISNWTGLTRSKPKSTASWRPFSSVAAVRVRVTIEAHVFPTE